MSSGYSVVGKGLPQIDSFDKVTGRVQYAGNIRLPGMLYAKVLRSPHAYAKVVKIDTAKAEELPGVVAVITHKDCPQKEWICPMFTWKGPVMGPVVRHIGDEVAAVAAVDEELAEEAVDLIEVEYEELSPVFDIDEARKLEQTQVRPDTNPQRPTIFKWGNLDRSFKEADFVVETETRFSQQAQAPLDRNACIASWSGDHLTVWTATQSPFWLRSAIAAYFNMPLIKVRVIGTHIGGSFGFWLQNNFMFISILLARKARRPVRLELTREEVFATVKRRETSIDRIRVGARNDGTLTAASYLHLFDNGAYGNKFDPWQVDADLYRVHSGIFETIGISTNLVTAGDMRGVGNVTLGYAIAKTMDMVAEKLDMDPVEFAMKNHIQTGDTLFTSQEITVAKAMFNKNITIKLSSCGLDECLVKGMEAIGWKDKWKGWGKPVKVNGLKRYGIGVGISADMSGVCILGSNGIFVRINPDASVHLIMAVTKYGQGADTALAQIVAEVLGITLEDIVVSAADTDICPPIMGTVGNASMPMVSRAVKAAAEDAKRQVLKLASQKLEVKPDGLDIKGHKVYVKQKPEKWIMLKELLCMPLEESLSEPTIVGSAAEGFPYDQTTKLMIAHFAEVEVDTETGKVKVLKYVAAHDSGKIINPAIARCQVQGAVLMGCGLALTENMVFDEKTGMILNPNFVDYRIPGPLDLPDPEVIFVETIDPCAGAFGAKGLGDAGTCACCPAIANAVHNAIGVRVDPPITPERVLKALGKL